jgi:CRISPR/Cas system CSM-associated protein Csm4 (group 5 of RAMP superfamily)
MAIILGVSAATVRAIAKREGIVPFSRDVKTYHGTTEWFFWTESDYDSFVSERKRRNANYSPRTTLAQWASDESLREKIVKSMESESARKAREAADAAALIIKERNERRAARKVILVRHCQAEKRCGNNR